MNELKSWFQGLDFNAIWNDADAEIRLLQRGHVFFFGFKLLSLLWTAWAFHNLASEFAGVGALQNMAFFSGSTVLWLVGSALLSLVTMAAVRARSEYGWLGMIILASQSLFSVLLPIAAAGFYYLMRPSLRAKFAAKPALVSV